MADGLRTLWLISGPRLDPWLDCHSPESVRVKLRNTQTDRSFPGFLRQRTFTLRSEFPFQRLPETNTCALASVLIWSSDNPRVSSSTWAPCCPSIGATRSSSSVNSGYFKRGIPAKGSLWSYNHGILRCAQNDRWNLRSGSVGERARRFRGGWNGSD